MAARPRRASGGGGGGGGGGEEEAEQAADPGRRPVEQGDLLLANWVDYSAPANYKGYTKDVGPKIKVSGFGSNDEILAKLRAGGAKYDVISPTGYAVKTMADLGLIMPLTHELIPNMKNITPAFTETDYDPGNKYSVPKDYGITSFYWLTDKVSEKPATINECFDLLKTPKFKDLRVNFLEGGTQVMAIALAGLGYSINTEDQKEIDEAKQLLVDVKPNVDTINSTFIERATRGEIDFGMGWNGDIRRAIVALDEEGPRDGLPRARGQHGVLGRQLGHPDRRRAPRRRAQVDQLRARPRQRRARDELPPVPGAGRGDQGRRPGPRQRSGDQHPGREDRGLRVVRSRPPRACSSATGPTRSSRPPDHGGGRGDLRGGAARPRDRAAAWPARSPAS